MDLRLLIVDDNAQFLRAARDLLEREGMDVVAVASTSAEALARAAEVRPDVALVDVVLGEESGLDLAQRLADGPVPQPRVVLVSTYARQDFADLIDESPAVGFLSKSDLSGGALRQVLSEPRGR